MPLHPAHCSFKDWFSVVLKDILVSIKNNYSKQNLFQCSDLHIRYGPFEGYGAPQMKAHSLVLEWALSAWRFPPALICFDFFYFHSFLLDSCSWFGTRSLQICRGWCPERSLPNTTKQENTGRGPDPCRYRHRHALLVAHKWRLRGIILHECMHNFSG